MSVEKLFSLATCWCVNVSMCVCVCLTSSVTYCLHPLIGPLPPPLCWPLWILAWLKTLKDRKCEVQAFHQHPLIAWEWGQHRAGHWNWLDSDMFALIICHWYWWKLLITILEAVEMHSDKDMNLESLGGEMKLRSAGMLVWAFNSKLQCMNGWFWPWAKDLAF